MGGVVTCHRSRTTRGAAVGGALAVGGYATLQWLGRTYGSTRAERRRRLPGDELCPQPQFQTDHATTIGAPPEQVWPWLVQMGWGRGQWYTPRWVDRVLFPANGPSAEAIVPKLQQLALGDGCTRFLFRCRARLGPWWVRAIYLTAMVPADFVMSRQMLRGVKRRVEHLMGPAPSSAAGDLNGRRSA